MENCNFAYDNGVIEQLDLYPKYGSNLQQISQKDYGTKYPFDPNIKALDLDRLEHDAHKSSIKKSMDAAIAVLINSNNIHSSSHLLLIEFRMDCVSIGQISCTELKNKVSFSSNMLSGTAPIDTKHYIFVYKSGFCEQVKNYFFRKRKSNDIPLSYLALSPEILIVSSHFSPS